MALHWDVSKIVEREGRDFVWAPTGEKDEEGKPLYRLRNIVETMIWSTMAIGIGEITEKNVNEVARRMAIYEQIRGPMRRNAEGGVYYTREEIARLVGLSTNVFPKEPEAQWKRRILDSVWSEATYNAERHLKEASKAHETEKRAEQ